MDRILPSHFDIIPNVAALDNLLDLQTPCDRRRAVRRETEQLIYYLRGACWSMELIEDARKSAVDFYCLQEPAVIRELILAEDLRDRIWFALDSYLTNMRRVFDALIPYLGRCPIGLSLPSSFRDLISGLNTGKPYNLDSVIKTLLQRCWDEVGAKITAYRDQSMHTAIISGDCIVYTARLGAVGLEVLLPDNPNERSPSKITYDPGTPLMGFVASTLYKTIQFVNAIVERMIDLIAPNDPNARTTSLMTFTPRRKSFEFGPEVERNGEPVPFSVDSHTIAKRAASEPLAS
jgi:hypothetical protein